MSFTHKLSKRLAVIRSVLLVSIGVVAFGCSRDATNSNIPDFVRLAVVPESLTVNTSQTYQLAVYGLTAAGDSVALQGQAVSWSTDDPDVATVSDRGLITAHTQGTVTITASSKGKNGHGHVKVDPPSPPPPHAGWHVAPNGSSSNSGTAGSPWSLTYALSGAAGRIQPGDTVWLHGGTYSGQQYRATVAGAAGKPVVVRQFPGERATIDVAGATSSTSRGDGFVVKGNWTEWWDFELMSSDPNRYTSTRPNMMINDANHTRYIDLVVHDGGIGFYNYETASDVEFNGNIVYNNGWQIATKGEGHCFYMKSSTGPVVLRDNICFNQMGYGIHVYTDAGAGELINIALDGNVLFNTGSTGPFYNSQASANILVGGEEPVSGSKVTNNMAYYTPGYGVNNFMMGYNDFANVDLTLTNNYVVGGRYVLTTRRWDQVTASGNQLIGSSGVVRIVDTTLSGYTWGTNTYLRDANASAWQYNGTDYSFANWKARTGLGLTDLTVPTMPVVPKVFVRPSRYQTGRATIVVYNWGRGSSVPVDLTGILPVGARYELRNVQSWYGAPITTGTYGGGAIDVPMTGVTPPDVVGGAPHPAPRTGPDFDVFVVRALN
jgi:hypothetical protein